MLRATATLALAAIVPLLALPGCNSSYIPQARGRVSMILMNGAPAYVRDGQVIQHGFLGNGLVRAVRGNPAAERAAAEYHDRQRDGLLVSLGGLVCSVAAAAKMASDLSDQPRDDGQSGDVPNAAWLALGCFGLTMGGLGYVISAEPYRYDAINIFNDTTPSWVPAAPGTVSQRPDAPTLRMPR